MAKTGSAGLASTLNNHSNRLAKIGRHAEAVAVSEEAIAYFERIPETDRDRYILSLASALDNYATELEYLGRYAEAILISERILTIHEELPERWAATLACLGWLARWLITPCG